MYRSHLEVAAFMISSLFLFNLKFMLFSVVFANCHCSLPTLYSCCLTTGLFMALRHSYHGEKDVFVDGGVLCNYPIHCFDGRS